MDEVLISDFNYRFTKLLKFSKPIIKLILLLPLTLQAQIPAPCLPQWEDLPYQNDSVILATFPDFISCCGAACEGQKDSLLARAFHIKAIIQVDQNMLLEAVVSNKKALAIRQQAKPLNPTDVGHSHLNLGIIFSHNLHRYQQSRKQLDTAWQYVSQGKNYELRGDCILERHF